MTKKNMINKIRGLITSVENNHENSMDLLEQIEYLANKLRLKV